MKNQRTSVVMEMVFSLQEKGYFTESEITSELGISRSTFFRSLSDLRCYLMERKPWLEVDFDSSKGTYRYAKVL